MKASNKSSIITGVVLLLLAALFSISLLLQPLDFGVGGPGHNNFFFLIGNILYTVYGFSSILIPVFLFVAGLSCFATKWTARKTMYLLTAIVPFFTAVITENICRSILALGNSNFTPVKIIISLITGIMLIVIEFLGAGILADKINNGDFNKDKKDSNDEKTVDEIEEKILEDIADEVVVDEIKSEETDKTMVFDEALSEVKPVEESEQENSEEKEAENKEPVAEEIKEEPENEEETSAQENPVSVITQEEYAALTVQDEEAEEELEWPDLPPKPETLPPEYVEEIDENDPALDFPPKEEEENESILDDFVAESETESETESISDEIVLDEETSKEEAVDENPFADFDITVDETEDSSSKEDIISFSEFEEESSSNNGEIPSEEKNDPYATTKYLDSVVENPSFPHGITIHDGTEEPAEDVEEKKNSKIEKPKFPTRISFEDDLEQEIQAYEDAEEDDDFSVFDIDEPAINSKKILEPAKSAETTSTELPEESEPEMSIEDFMDIDIKDDEFDENSEDNTDFSEEIQENPENSTNNFLNSIQNDQIFDQITEQENESEPTISSAIADVFSDMEADIRKKNGIPEKTAQIAETNDIQQKNNINNDIDYNEANDFSEEMMSSGPVEPNTATNLTKDELTDFFDAQSKENAPVTKEIEANPPKTNRATKKGPYLIPSSLLTAYKGDEYWVIDDATKEAAMNLKQTLAEFSIEAKIIGIKKGPVVTMFEILPAPGVRLNRIVALQDNIALSLAAQSIRIVAPIPGKQAVGIEVPNRNRSIVGFREIIEMDLPEWNKMAVPVILGKDILGKAQLIDLVKTPHMLIAGATGSGKSVCVNSLILSILYKRSFRDVKLILVDPKVVELKLYNNIPHLLTPVITEPKKALQALQYCLCEMERRYALLDSMGVRDISTYNQRIKEREIATEKLPYIVVIIDEFADLMATSGKELESIVARLTAMSRAVGIHLVLATQRPSVNVITGLIKANIPTRIAFMVASRTDSNIIIDSVGAEKLLGRGDMLFASAVDPAPVRIQGTFVNDNEVENVVNAVKEYGEPDYIDDEIFVDDDDDVENLDLFGSPMSDEDPLYDQALEIVVQAGKASASYIQRRLKIGYNRAARLVEEMEERGIVGPANGSKPREIIHIP